MTDERPDLESLFLSALDIRSADERAAFLTRSCGDDAALRAEIEMLLASHRDAGSFLQQPAAELVATLAPGAADARQAGVLEAGLASAFREYEAVVVGHAGHSVLKAMGQTMDMPRV